jgi:predicted Zn-dependent protease with MMP-like domain
VVDETAASDGAAAERGAPEGVPTGSGGTSSPATGGSVAGAPAPLATQRGPVVLLPRATQRPVPTRRRRDRRGRGMRGTLFPPDVPAYSTRGERFDDLVLDAVEHLDLRWSDELAGVEFAVEDVPPVGVSDEEVPLALFQPATGRGRSATPRRIVVYRRPLEARAVDTEDLAELVLDAIIHEVADMLGVDPAVIDPEGHGWGDEE